MALPVPEPVNSRVYIGGLGEQATLQDMDELFKEYEPYQDLNLLRGYGFVQFPSEEGARKAIEGLNGQLHKGRKLTVKIANDNRGKKGLLPRGGGGPPGAQGNAPVRDRSPIDGNRYAEGYPQRSIYSNMYPRMDMGGYPDPMMGGMQGPPPPSQPDSNDCEIIVVSRDLTTYAENIEARLKRNGLTVDLLFPNDDVPIGKVLSNIASRGSYYAILITPENQERNSITVNVLYGVPAEHRNMPSEDALMFICNDFQDKVRAEQEKAAKYRASMASSGPGNPHMMYNKHSLQDKHPEAIQNMLNLLANNRQLTVMQYERLIKYLSDRKELQIKYELGEDTDSVSASSLLASKSKAESEKELQKKIMDILNKPSIVPPKKVLPEPEKDASRPGGFSSFGNMTIAAAAASGGSAVSKAAPASGGMGSTSSSAPVANAAPKLLHDPKVQKALDSLLLSGLGGALKF